MGKNARKTGGYKQTQKSGHAMKKNTNEFRCERGFKTGGVKGPEDNVEYGDQ